MTLIILHCFYHDNEIRGYAQSRPQGLINIRDKVPLSFVLCGGCYERLTFTQLKRDSHWLIRGHTEP